MECTRTEDLLSSYLDGDLPDREREGIVEHLRQCPRCAEEERALKETLSLLRNLPAETAPPGLLEGVRRRIGTERAAVPLWKKLFLPAHIKIPLEAAAVALIFLLAYGIQKEMPATKVPPSPIASIESEKPESGTGMRADRQKTDALRKRPADAADREVKAETTPAEPKREAPAEKERATVPGPSPEKPSVKANSELPAGLAARVSTQGGAIEPAFPQKSPARETPAPRGFVSPLSRLQGPLLHGREVTIEVAQNERIGMEDRIAELALRLGGAVRWEGVRTAEGAAEEMTPFPQIVRVRVPVDSADTFLEELGKLGTIPPEETPGKIDIPAGPSPAAVIYTVRIRVR